jgi:hypothetical protein
MDYEKIKIKIERILEIQTERTTLIKEKSDIESKINGKNTNNNTAIVGIALEN